MLERKFTNSFCDGIYTMFGGDYRLCLLESDTKNTFYFD